MTFQISTETETLLRNEMEKYECETVINIETFILSLLQWFQSTQQPEAVIE